MTKIVQLTVVVACLLAQNFYIQAYGQDSPEEKKSWGKRLKNSLRVDKAFKGVASFYASRFHGRKTASGEIYDENEMSCAHRTLPFGTKLEVTNPSNGKTVEVEVNDRGPYKKNRVLDLSKAAAKKLGITGLAKVIFKPKTEVAQSDSNEVH